MVAEALKNIQFRWLLGSSTAFFLVLHGQMLTRSVLAWRLTGDEMSLAWINLAFALPMVVVAFPGGVLTDRINRLAILKVCQLLLLINELVIFALLLTGDLALWQLILSCIVGGLLFPIVLPTRTAIVFNLVGNRLLGSATALTMTTMNISRVIGPALMGALIAAQSITAAYGLASALFFIAWLCTLPINNSYAPNTVKAIKTSIAKDISEGFRYIHNNKPIMLSILFGVLPMMLTIPMHTILVLFTDTIWHVGEQGLGIAMSVAGLGGTLGALWITKRSQNPKRTNLMFSGALSFGILVICFSFSQSFYVALVLLFFANAGSAVSSTLNHTITQLLADDEQRGRVSSMSMAAIGFAPVIVAPIAWGAKHYGVDVSVAVAAILLTAVTLVFFLRSNVLRELDQHVKDAT